MSFFRGENSFCGDLYLENTASLAWYKSSSNDDMMLPYNPQDPFITLQQH